MGGGRRGTLGIREGWGSGNVGGRERRGVEMIERTLGGRVERREGRGGGR